MENAKKLMIKNATKLMVDILTNEYYEGKRNVERPDDGGEEKASKLLASILKAFYKDSEVGWQLEVLKLKQWCQANLDDIEAEIRHPEDGYPYREYYNVGEEMYRSLINLGWLPPLKK